VHNPETDALILKTFREVASQAETGRLLGIPTSTIWTRLKEMGAIPKRTSDQDLLAACALATSYAEAASALCMPRTTLLRRAKKLGVVFRTGPSLSEVREACANHSTYVDAAKALGTNRVSLFRRAKREGFPLKVVVTDEQIVLACTTETTMGRAAASLEKSLHWLKPRAIRLGCWEPNITGVNTKIPLADILEGKHPEYNVPSLHRRLIAEGGYARQCQHCLATQWRDQPIPLDLHHANFVHRDHRRGNILLLCRNCHKIAHTLPPRRATATKLVGSPSDPSGRADPRIETIE